MLLYVTAAMLTHVIHNCARHNVHKDGDGLGVDYTIIHPILTTVLTMLKINVQYYAVLIAYEYIYFTPAKPSNVIRHRRTYMNQHTCHGTCEALAPRVML